jgi:transcriptional regulator with XRE-family HTH domain
MKRNRYSSNEEVLRHLLRGHRLNKEIRQEDLAKTLQVHQSFVSKYESGERLLTFVEVINICKALAIDPIKLVKEYQKYHETR